MVRRRQRWVTVEVDDVRQHQFGVRRQREGCKLGAAFHLGLDRCWRQTKLKQQAGAAQQVALDRHVVKRVNQVAPFVVADHRQYRGVEVFIQDLRLQRQPPRNIQRRHANAGRNRVAQQREFVVVGDVAPLGQAKGPVDDGIVIDQEVIE
ncbi:MAG TPA: hypothetical protein EYP98_10695 [Planctomycetes bacterium]|nr:hypothetical protein [Planctomycetota bacterium]